MRQMMRMTKSECLMTKEIQISNDNNLAERCEPPLFALRHYFVIRHSSFVIFKLLLVLLLGIATVSCVGRRITKANVDEVAEGMSKKQGESILGPPTEFDNKDFVILKKTTYTYRQGSDSVTIIFKYDKVVEKQSTLTN